MSLCSGMECLFVPCSSFWNRFNMNSPFVILEGSFSGRCVWLCCTEVTNHFFSELRGFSRICLARPFAVISVPSSHSGQRTFGSFWLDFARFDDGLFLVAVVVRWSLIAVAPLKNSWTVIWCLWGNNWTDGAWKRTAEQILSFHRYDKRNRNNGRRGGRNNYRGNFQNSNRGDFSGHNSNWNNKSRGNSSQGNNYRNNNRKNYDVRVTENWNGPADGK